MSTSIRILTLPFLPQTAAFDTTALEALARHSEILRAVPAFFEHAGQAYWSLFVVHRLRQAPEERATRERVGRPQRDLSEAEAALYEALRAWRAEAADAAGVPVFMILTNRQIAEIARLRPASRASLGTIQGIGPGRIRKHGPAVLEVVQRFDGGASIQSEVAPATDAGAGHAPGANPHAG